MNWILDEDGGAVNLKHTVALRVAEVGSDPITNELLYAVVAIQLRAHEEVETVLLRASEEDCRAAVKAFTARRLT